MQANTNLYLLRNDQPTKIPKDATSRWIILQDWSTCTLACGSGSQTQQRFCLQPQGTDPCEGRAILTRPCNTQPCQNITDNYEESEVKTTQIKILPVSNRPQRFIKCIIKEEDLDIVRSELSNLKVPVRIPSRVILNNKTLSIFEAQSYETLYKSFILREIIEFKAWNIDPNRCLRVADRYKDIVMCVMNTDQSDPNMKIKAWVKDIIDFRDNCERQPILKQIDDPRLKEFKQQLLQQDMINELGKVQKKEKQKKQDEKAKALKYAQLMALRVFIIKL